MMVDARCGEVAGYVRKVDTLQDIEVTEQDGLVHVSQRVTGACDSHTYLEATGADFASALPTVAPEEYCAFDVPDLSGCL